MSSLEAQHLRFSYDRRAIFAGLGLAARPGEVLAVIGPNGAGKTTLLRLLARLVQPHEGTVLLAGENIWRLAPRQVARRLALAPQAATLAWPLTVEQAVALGRAPHRGWLLPLTAQDRSVVERAMRHTGLVALRDRRVTALSGGEQRRVILARALAQEPRVLLLDEPTAYLDLKYQVEILELARQLAHREGLVVILSLHDLNLAALYADRLALLGEGQLVASGTPSDVLTAERLSSVYGLPVSVTPHPLDGTPLVMPVVDGVGREA
ncbi:MAG TPA: heme ABC transporter ATP-binding protein [Ardenticatenaceae bacterium]|nr:heme ABC transporter ATP-binding protein [Ardenticatenaceae bacterium]